MYYVYIGFSGNKGIILKFFTWSFGVIFCLATFDTQKSHGGSIVHDFSIPSVNAFSIDNTPFKRGGFLHWYRQLVTEDLADPEIFKLNDKYYLLGTGEYKDSFPIYSSVKGVKFKLWKEYNPSVDDPKYRYCHLRSPSAISISPSEVAITFTAVRSLKEKGEYCDNLKDGFASYQTRYNLQTQLFELVSTIKFPQKNLPETNITCVKGDCNKSIRKDIEVYLDKNKKFRIFYTWLESGHNISSFIWDDEGSLVDHLKPMFNYEERVIEAADVFHTDKYHYLIYGHGTYNGNYALSYLKADEIEGLTRERYQPKTLFNVAYDETKGNCSGFYGKKIIDSGGHSSTIKIDGQRYIYFHINKFSYDQNGCHQNVKTRDVYRSPLVILPNGNLKNLEHILIQWNQLGNEFKYMLSVNLKDGTILKNCKDQTSLKNKNWHSFDLSCKDATAKLNWNIIKSFNVCAESSKVKGVVCAKSSIFDIKKPSLYINLDKKLKVTSKLKGNFKVSANENLSIKRTAISKTSSTSFEYKFVSPGENKIYNKGEGISLKTNVSEFSDIVKVQYWKDQWEPLAFLDNSKKNIASAFSFDLPSGLSVGEHILRSRLTTLNGETKEARINLKVVELNNTQPYRPKQNTACSTNSSLISFMSFRNDTNLFADELMNIKVQAISVGPVSKVDFWIDNWQFLASNKGVLSNGTYNVAIEGMSVGDHCVLVRYSNSAGQILKEIKTQVNVLAARALKRGNKSSLGVNIGWITAWSEQNLFIDTFKVAQGKWLGRPADFSCYGCREIEVDQFGWVKKLDKDVVAELGVLSPKAFVGKYTILYEGKGELVISVNGKSEIISHSKGRAIVEYVKEKNSFLRLRITKTDPSNYIRNIRVLVPGGICNNNPLEHANVVSDCKGKSFTPYEKIYERIIFHGEFLKEMSSFKLFRFMDAWNINLNKMKEPEDMKTLSSATWSNFLPVKAIITLSNLLNTDVWINIPHYASSRMVSHIARELKAGLKDNISVYIEHSNEVWNFGPGFPHHGDSSGLACSKYPDLIKACDNEVAYQEQTKINRVGNGILCEGHNFPWIGECAEAVYRYHSDRTVKFGKIFKNIIGSKRVFTIMAGQAANVRLNDNLLKYNDNYKNVDALAVAPYFGKNFTNGEVENLLINDHAAAVNNFFNDLLPDIMYSTNKFMKKNASLAARYSVELFAYEGGPHITAYKGSFVNGNKVKTLTEIGKFIQAIDRDSRMKASVTYNLNSWQDVGGGVFMYYKNYANPNNEYMWGLFEFTGQGVKSSQKMQGVLDYIDSNH